MRVGGGGSGAAGREWGGNRGRSRRKGTAGGWRGLAGEGEVRRGGWREVGERHKGTVEASGPVEPTNNEALEDPENRM